MATKTTSTTDNNAGCSPCTPEAHQRSVFHNQTRKEKTMGQKKRAALCECGGEMLDVVPGEFDLEEAVRRLAIYIREHSVPMNHSPGA